jgi:hypothetical protein
VAVQAETVENRYMTFVRVTGTLGGEPVWATWEDGELYGDERLLATVRDHVRTGEALTLGGIGPLVPARIDDPWSFTVAISALVDDPVVSGDDLPHVEATRSDEPR